MKPSILIVDDNEQVRTAVATWLTAMFPGCTFFSAKCGTEALDMVEKRKPVVVLMDICMPDMTGIAVIHEMRRRELPVEVIVLTAHDESHYRREAEEAGAQAYVLKDEAPRKLPALMKQALCQWVFETSGQA